MRKASATLVALALAACGTNEQQNSNPDAGTTQKKHDYVDITGTVQFHPLEVAWRGNLLGQLVGPGPAPSLAGTTIRIENSTDALLKRPPLTSATLTEDGKFSFTHIDVVNVSIALVGSVKDDSGKIMESGYGIHRYQPSEARPTEFKDKPVYVISTEMEKKLADAVGKSTEDLEADGFVFGRVVDGEGHGIAGAQVAKLSLGAGGLVPKPLENPANPEDPKVIYYLNDDLTATSTEMKTSASGAFLMFPGSGTAEYSAIKEGATFETHLSGARQGTALSLFIESK